MKTMLDKNLFKLILSKFLDFLSLYTDFLDTYEIVYRQADAIAIVIA